MPPPNLVPQSWNNQSSGHLARLGKVLGGVAIAAATAVAVRIAFRRLISRQEHEEDIFSETHQMPTYAVVPSRASAGARADQGALEALLKDLGGDGGAEHYLDALWDEEEEQEEIEIAFEDSVEYIERFFGFQAIDPTFQGVRNDCLRAIDATLLQLKGTKLPLRNQFTGQEVDTEVAANEEFDDVMSNPDPILQVAAAVEVSLRQRLLFIAKKLGVRLGGDTLPAYQAWSVPVPETLDGVDVSLGGLLEVAKEYLEICVEIDRTKEQTVEINIEKATAEEGYGEWASRTEAFKKSSKNRKGFMDVGSSDEDAEATTFDDGGKRYFGGRALGAKEASNMDRGSEDNVSENDEDEEDVNSNDGLEELHDVNRRSFEALLMKEIFRRVATTEKQREYDELLEEPLNGFIEPYLLGVDEDSDDDSRIEGLLRDEGSTYEKDLLRQLLARQFDDDDDYAHRREDELYEDVGDDWVDY